MSYKECFDTKREFRSYGRCDNTLMWNHSFSTTAPTHSPTRSNPSCETIISGMYCGRKNAQTETLRLKRVAEVDRLHFTARTPPKARKKDLNGYRRRKLPRQKLLTSFRRNRSKSAEERENIRSDDLNLWHCLFLGQAEAVLSLLMSSDPGFVTNRV